MDKYKIVKKIRRSGTSLAINIPVEVIELLKLKESDLVEIEIKRIK